VYKSSLRSFVGVLLFAGLVIACAPSTAPAPTVVGELPPTETLAPTMTLAPASPSPEITRPMATLPAPTPSLASTAAAAPTVGVQTRLGLKQIERNPKELRAAWVHDNFIATPAKVDETIRRAELGHVNVIVANVFEQGMALYDSSLASKHPIVQHDFNPLAYLVDQAHRRGIQVQAWFVNGPVEFKGQSKIIDQHPEWAIVGPDGKKMAWMNFARPDVRQFYSDLMWEVVTRYGVDGLFFDFTRYPGPEWGFDPYSITTFNSSHDFNLEELRYQDLPAYGYFEGASLPQASSAQVLATFSNGTPAVATNKYGQGQVILLNWRASARTVGAESEIMRRSIKQLLKEGGQVSIYKPDGELDDNATQSLEEMTNWLRDLGWQAREVLPQELKTLALNSVLVVTYGYDLSAEGASSMADWVSRGGGLIFNDAPSRSISLAPIRALTGMQGRGKNTGQWTFLLPAGDNPLIPSGKRQADLAIAQARESQWVEFRKQGVNAVIQGVYQRIKAQYPQVDVSVTVTSNQDTASRRTMQDWRAWLEGGYADYIVPRGYVEEVEELNVILAAWRPAMQQYKRVTLGVSTFGGKHKQRVLKSPSQLLDEISRAHQAGSYGIMIWNLDYINDDQLKGLAAGPFKVP
jgi:uncharacterized lipoprotein YddW (UPF0748 family)